MQSLEINKFMVSQQSPNGHQLPVVTGGFVAMNMGNVLLFLMVVSFCLLLWHFDTLESY